jgi:hypothetical protein
MRLFANPGVPLRRWSAELKTRIYGARRPGELPLGAGTPDGLRIRDPDELMPNQRLQPKPRGQEVRRG